MREYVHAWCSMLHSLLLDMQHDHVLKMLNFAPQGPWGEGGREGGGGGGGLRAKYLRYNVAAFVIPFNLICNKKLDFDPQVDFYNIM